MGRLALIIGFFMLAVWQPVVAQPPMTSTRAELEELLSGLFADSDANADGVHTFAERKAAIETEPGLGDLATRLKIAQGAFDREDADRNRQVTLTEFSSDPIASFDCMDTDNDGTVSEQERAAASPACDIGNEA